jgi:hypothetical protein
MRMNITSARTLYAPAYVTAPALGCAPEPFGVFASVEGWECRFWVQCGYGLMPVAELIDLIVYQFGRRVPVFIPLEDCILRDSRREPINPSHRVIDVLENNSSVIVTF